jgi:sugar lactone lactonase YvrE
MDYSTKMKTRILTEDLLFPECPRWYDGKLWFSDVHAMKVMTVDSNGNAETVLETPAPTAGLGWLPDGRLLVVSAAEQRLLRLDPEGLVEVANLSSLATSYCNDMVVDRKGRAYIGHFGFDLFANAPFAPATLIMVMPDGQSRVVADNMAFPNGSVITPDDSTLIVGETYAARLTAFDIESDGSLTGRRVWAQLEGAAPDGICLDEESAVWVASPSSASVLRVLEGGEVTHQIGVSTRAFACMLGGKDRRTLFVLTAESSNPTETLASRSGRIEIVEVDVPGAGIP